MGLNRDLDRVTRFVSEVRKASRTLQEIGGLPQESFLNDADKIGNAKYQLIVAIEGCIDLANHLIAANEFRAADDYADAFRVLAEENVLDDAFATRLGEMARFRNRLVHIYWDIDDAQIHRFLNDDVNDIPRFIETILDRLD